MRDGPSQPSKKLRDSGLNDPVIGVDVAGYVIKSRLGLGGMGIVYEGEQPTIGKRVAIKVLRPEVADDEALVQRLVGEARAVNSVGHRGIVDVFALGHLPDGRQCIVMEYLDGEPLDEVMRSTREEGRLLGLSDSFTILDEVLSALSAAHTAGIIHRDLKPSNIFLCRQRDGTRFIKVLDFGIAKLGVLGSAAARASMVVGTPSYMAPEQAATGSVTPALDLYAVGVMAYELLTGRLPFIADTVLDMLLKHANDVPERPSNVDASLPQEVDALVLQLLAKKPGDRPQTAAAVRDELARLKRLLPPSAGPSLFVPSKTSGAGTSKFAAAAGQCEPARRPITSGGVPLATPAARSAPLLATPAYQSAAVVPEPAVAVPTPTPAPARTDSLEDLAAVRGSTGRARLFVGAAVVLALGGGLAVYATSGTANPDVAPVEAPPAKAEAPVGAPKPVEQPPASPAPAAVVAAPEVVPPPQAVAAAEPGHAPPPVVAPSAPAPKAQPASPVRHHEDSVEKPTHGKSSTSSAAGLLARVHALQEKMSQKADRGSGDDFYLTTLRRFAEKLADPALDEEARQKLELGVERLESELSEH